MRGVSYHGGVSAPTDPEATSHVLEAPGEAPVPPRWRGESLLEDPAPARFEWWWTWWLLWLAGTVVELWRVSGERGWQSLWGEDSGVFLSQQLAIGGGRALFTSYNGYGHLVPRLLTSLNVLWPLRDVPALVCGEAAAVASLCAVVIARASRTLVPSWFLRVAMGATLLVLPITRVENLTNLANCQWYLLSALVWVVLWRPRHWTGRILAVLVIAGAFGSSPLAALVLPVLLWRLWAWRDRFNAVLVGVALLGGWYQWLLVATINVHHYRQASAPTVPELLHLYGLRVVTGSFGGWTQTTTLYEQWHFGVSDRILLVAIVSFLALAALLRQKRMAVAAGFFLISAVFFALTLDLRGFALSRQTVDSILSTGARYSVVPLMLLVGALVLTLQSVVERLRWCLPFFVAAMVFVASTWYPSEQALSYRTPNVPWSVALTHAQGWCQGKPSRAVINVPTTPQGWYARVPCRALGVPSSGRSGRANG